MMEMMHALGALAYNAARKTVCVTFKLALNQYTLARPEPRVAQRSNIVARQLQEMTEPETVPHIACPG